MILEIINQANEYAAEYKFAAMLNHFDQLKVRSIPGGNISQKDLESKSTEVERIFDNVELDQKFSVEFKRIFVSTLSGLIYSGDSINVENCYKLLISPILDQCEQNYVTKDNLKNLLSELDSSYFVLVSANLKVQPLDISENDIYGAEAIEDKENIHPNGVAHVFNQRPAKRHPSYEDDERYDVAYHAKRAPDNTTYDDHTSVGIDGDATTVFVGGNTECYI